MLKEWKKRQEFIDLISSVQNLLGEEQHIPMKTIESLDGTYIQYDRDDETYFRVLSVEEYLKKKKLKFIVVLLFEYDW